MIVLVTFVSLFSVLISTSSTLFQDDVCKLEDNNIGICKYVYNCPFAIMELKRKMGPKTCSFDGFIPIVCCPKSNEQIPVLDSEEDIVSGKVSSQKCNNYAGLVYQNHSSPTLLPGILYEIEDTCVIKEESYRSSTVLSREFPHLASIGYDSTAGQVWKCSGGLISEQYVLTAATCSDLQGLGVAKYIRVGSTSVRENFYHEKPLQYFSVQEFVQHPKFNRVTLRNNIALVKLSGLVKFTSIVRPACLRENRNKWKEAINVGWGTLNNNHYMNNEPLKNLVRIVDSGKSNNSTHQFRVEQVAGSLWQNCLVDQGSVLQVYNDEKYCTYDIVGVLSAWNDCYLNRNGVYTNVTTYIPWIENIVWV